MMTAAMEEIYERLCWIYTTVQTSFVYDHLGNTYYLSDLTELSEGKILYPEQFANKPDYEQNSLLQNLQMKDVLCTRSDWIKQGRNPSDSVHFGDLTVCRWRTELCYQWRHPIQESCTQGWIRYQKGYTRLDTLSEGFRSSHSIGWKPGTQRPFYRLEAGNPAIES
jgi:hypothetical protein